MANKNSEAFKQPLWVNNPVLVQILGICSALAVTAQLKPAIVMGLSVTVIVAMSNVIISLLRNTIPNRIRIIIQLVVVAALVTIVSEILKAFAYDVSVQLSVYVGLIITNWVTVWVMLPYWLWLLLYVNSSVAEHCSVSRLYRSASMRQVT